MKTRKGIPNIKPSRAEIRGYYALLRSAAQRGDAVAAAELIKIDHMTNQTQREVATQ